MLSNRAMYPVSYVAFTRPKCQLQGERTVVVLKLKQQETFRTCPTVTYMRKKVDTLWYEAYIRLRRMVLNQSVMRTEQGQNNIFDRSRAIWAMLKNDVKRAPVLFVNYATQLLDLRIFHDVPPYHFDILGKKSPNVVTELLTSPTHGFINETCYF